MLETLSERLGAIFARLGNRGRLTEADVDDVAREVRVALLEADVNLAVAKDFVARVKEQAVGADVLASLTPAQSVLKIVHDELGARDGRGGRAAAVRRRAAVGDHARRAPGLRQDDPRRQARTSAEGTGPPLAARRRRRLSSGRYRPARDAGQDRSICPCMQAIAGTPSRSPPAASPRRGGSACRPSSSTRPGGCRSTTTLMTELERDQGRDLAQRDSASSPTR